jgi:hypothetical protein
MSTQTVILEAAQLAVVRLAPVQPAPAWAWRSSFVSVTATPAELSIVCEEAVIPGALDARIEHGFRLLRLEGPFAFSLTGVLASVLAPLAAAGVSVFAVSTFDTDYVMVPATALDAALSALADAGHTVRR